MIDQEVYDLTQTGQQVQNILDKGEALPSNPELQQALDSKADKGNTYTKCRISRSSRTAVGGLGGSHSAVAGRSGRQRTGGYKHG